MKLPHPPKEADHQKRAVEYVRAQGLHQYLVMIPNGTQLPGGPQTRARYMAHLKAMGLRVGASDLFLAWPVKTFKGAWFEMKARDGKLSYEQAAFQALMLGIGYYAVACWSFDEFKMQLDQYLAS